MLSGATRKQWRQWTTWKTWHSGKPGAPGRDGRDGSQGSLGSPGKTGPQGPAGVKGSKGEPGCGCGKPVLSSHTNWKECSWFKADGRDSGEIYVSHISPGALSFIFKPQQNQTQHVECVPLTNRFANELGWSANA